MRVARFLFGRRAVVLAALLGIIAFGVATRLRLAAAAEQSTGWSLQFERPATGKNEDFAFPTGQHGWLVTAGGYILHSADSGVTWNVQAAGLGRVRSVDFLDEKRGFAGTVTGQLYATIDAGASWNNITRTLPRRTEGFCGITHVGEQIHMVGRYVGDAADYFYSPDGGRTWQYQDLKPIAEGLVDVAFVNERVGFIGGMARSANRANGPATILKTVDGGRNWRPVFRHDGGRGYAWKIFPVSPQLIYASLQSQDGIYRIAKSTDGGDNWNVLTVATDRAAGPGLQGIGFIDENRGWVGGFFAGMFATTDGGRSWTEVRLPDRTINRFERVGNGMITAGTRGILRYTPPGRQ